VVAGSEEAQQTPFFCLEIQGLFGQYIQLKLSCYMSIRHRGKCKYSNTVPYPGAGRRQVVGKTTRSLYSGEKDPVPIVQKVEWALGLAWMGPENLTLTGVPTWTIQPTASHYTSCAMVTSLHLYRFG
jgi:hypothetical protein